MKFSIIHPSARPEKWQAVYEDWMSKCVDASEVEYILCADERWGFPRNNEREFAEMVPLPGFIVWNTGRRCYVDAVNIAAKQATGDILIVVADDQFACERWDQLLSDYLHLGRTDLTKHQQFLGSDKFVVEVSTGTPQEHQRGIIVLPILSRAWYEHLGGNVFFPEYESMYADNDFCEHARQDGVVIDCRHLRFEHRHPLANVSIPWDAAYAEQNRPQSYRIGQRILDFRRATKFSHEPIAVESKPVPTIALCLPGDEFRGGWVSGIMQLYAHLISTGWNVINLIGYTSNVYVTREEIRQAAMSCDPKPDYLLWLDDDNLCSPAHFESLFVDLQARPDADAVFGWCWIHNEAKTGFQTSCGTFSPDGSHWTPFPPSFANSSEVREVEASGFPCVLMRYSALEKAGDRPFIRGILDPTLTHGIGGEDMAFMRAGMEGGAKFIVDPKVRVPHLKYVTVEPVLESEGKAPVKIAVMMRVKNEARWIGRVIDSVKALGPVYVMDDGSTDDTYLIARDHGARLLPSPYACDPLDECRDKNFLLSVVKAEAEPDWILCIDGDEELEPAGIEKIRKACESGRADVFSLRVLYLWDGVDQIRFDRKYSGLARMSLFRVIDGLSFKSMYADVPGTVCHTGMHCENAPLTGGNLVADTLNAYLLHYGYMLKEDRIKKYEWYNRVDPNNEIEDCYRHIVQGDIPEVTADAILKHAGPLELRRLPRSLVPKDFDIGVLQEVSQ